MRSKIILFFILISFPLNRGMKAEMNVSNAQAIFIYNFLGQVQWPAGAVGDNYVIGVLGKNNVTEYLRKYTTNRQISKKPIKVVEYSSIDQISNCQVLFVPFDKSSQVTSINQQIKGKSVLLIGEKNGIIKSGAVIEFVVVDGKLRYKIDENNAKSQQLFISTALMNMAYAS